jgi:hypothetical protein
MPSINDRIGSQNVIRVLSNASAPPTSLLDLNDVETTLKTRDGMILVWDLTTEKFYMTDTIDSSSLNITGIATFSNTADSTAPTNGALVIDGGIGIGKAVNIGGDISVAGLSTFTSNVDINAAVDILNGVTANSTFKSVGITTLASAGGITTTGGELYVGTNLEVAGTSNFIGNATFRGGTIGIGDSTGDDIDVGGEFVSNLVPNTDNTYDIGITTQRWRDGKFGSLVSTKDLSVSDIATIETLLDVNGILDTTGGRIVGSATTNVIPFLYGTLSDLPSAAVYHGAFAHVHSTGKAYYAHAGNWWELVNRNLNGTVGTGTDTYNIGTLSVTGLTTTQNLRIAGISTFVGISTFENNVFVTGTLDAGLIDGGVY